MTIAVLNGGFLKAALDLEFAEVEVQPPAEIYVERGGVRDVREREARVVDVDESRGRDEWIIRHEVTGNRAISAQDTAEGCWGILGELPSCPKGICENGNGCKEGN